MGDSPSSARPLLSRRSLLAAAGGAAGLAVANSSRAAAQTPEPAYAITDQSNVFLGTQTISSSSPAEALVTNIANEPYHRFDISSEGDHHWGSGQAPTDISFYRGSGAHLGLSFASPTGWHNAFVLQRYASGDHEGGELQIKGRTPTQYMAIGQYRYGWRFQFVPGNDPFPEGQYPDLVEFYVPKFFSIAAQDNAFHPFLAIRDKADSADLSLRMRADAGFGEIRVGNVEGGPPAAPLGLRLITNPAGGATEVEAIIITPTGGVQTTRGLSVGASTPSATPAATFGVPVKWDADSQHDVGEPTKRPRDVFLGRDLAAGRHVAAAGRVSGKDGVTTKTKAGSITDVDFATPPPDGTLAIDVTGARLFARVGGIWRTVALK